MQFAVVVMQRKSFCICGEKGERTHVAYRITRNSSNTVIRQANAVFCTLRFRSLLVLGSDGLILKIWLWLFHLKELLPFSLLSYLVEVFVSTNQHFACTGQFSFSCKSEKTILFFLFQRFNQIHPKLMKRSEKFFKI